MSEEKRTLIVETVKNLRQMDKESLMLIKSGSELLKARDALDSKEEETETDLEAEEERINVD